jgi:SAM-dependent methyltransferase
MEIKSLMHDIRSRRLFNEWYESPLGAELMRMEKEVTDRAVANLFGYYILQLGCLGHGTFMQNTRIATRMTVYLEQDIEAPGEGSFVCAGDALAVASDSIDTVVLPHILEYTNNPHGILRETERVLIGDGHLIIIGFNPWSLWGMARFMLAWRDMPPWSGKFYGLMRIKDWLTLLGFEVLATERIFFRPPLQKQRVMKLLSFLEKLGKYCWSWFGGIYIITARKRVFPVNPIKLNWLEKRRLIASGLVRPSMHIQDGSH